MNPKLPSVLVDSEGNPVTFNYDFDFQAHDWVQGADMNGHEVVCDGRKCAIGHRHGHAIPSHKVLSGSRGNWSLIDFSDERELRRRKTPAERPPKVSKPKK